LAFYSSELKGAQQTVDLLAAIAEGNWQAGHNQSRYFNTLHAIDAVAGTRQAPTLTDLGRALLRVRELAPSGQLTDDGKRSVDKLILDNALDKIVANHATDVGTPVLAAIKNVQDLHEGITRENYERILADPEMAWIMQAINLQGTEIPRFFRLPEAAQSSIRVELKELFSSGLQTAGLPANIRDYVEAAGQVQKDIRFRVQGLLAGYMEACAARGSQMPILTHDLQLAERVGDLDRIIAERPTPSGKLEPIQLIVSGCPGSGKSYWIDQTLNRPDVKIYRVQFHDNLGYAEFVGTFKPRTLYEDSPHPLFDAADIPVIPSKRPIIDYAFVPGPMADAIVDAYSSPDVTVVVLIEEINRGNAAAAFGELFQSLDRKSDGVSRYPISLPNDLRMFLSRNGALDGDGFRFPPNLFIWASMNGADQGVQPIDSAFRRRWSYKYIGYANPCLYAESERRFRYGGEDIDWESFRATLNKKLVDLRVHEDKLIGPYFLTSKELKSPAEILTKLFLYLWEDVGRFSHADLFHDQSFAEVEARWNAGNGEPLRIVIEKRQENNPSAMVSPDGDTTVAAVPAP